MIGVLRNTGVRLEHTWQNDGQPIEPDGGVSSLTKVAITKADGSVLVPAGTDATRSAVGKFFFDLPPQAALNVLTVSWTALFNGLSQTIAEELEIVGGFYCNLADLKAIPNMPASITDAALLEFRRDFENLAEEYVGVAMVPRYHRDHVVGTGRTRVQLTKLRPRTVLSVSINGSVVADVSGYGLHPHGRLENLSGFPRPTIAGPNVFVEIEHGLDAPSESMRRACKLYVHHQAKMDRSAVGRDMLAETDSEGITARWSTPDWDAGRPTGLLDVDRTLNAARRSVGAG